MKTNKKCLVIQAVQGEIQNPIKKDYVIDVNGVPQSLPRGGSINYNVHLGFPAFGMEAEEIHPGVSIYNKEDNCNKSLRSLSCIGNKARVLDGKAEGAEGFVVGFQVSDTTSQVIIDFPEEDMEKMKIGDQILIKAYGQGLSIENYPQVKIFNIDPNVLDNMGIREQNGKLIIPVKYSIPAPINGTASTHGDAVNAEAHISSSLETDMKKYKLDNMRIGDIVFLENSDNCYANTYGKNASSVGVVVHGSGTSPSIGPGIVIIMSSKEDILKAEISEKANISYLLD